MSDPIKAPRPEKTTIYELATGKALEVFNVDAAEILKQGEYVTDPPPQKEEKAKK